MKKSKKTFRMKLKRYGNSLFAAVSTTMVAGIIFTAPFLSSVSSNAIVQKETYRLELTNSVAKEVYDFLYAYKKSMGTMAFDKLVSTGNAGDCSLNDLNINGVTTDAVDGYCVAQIQKTGTGLTVNHCAYTTGSGTLTDVQNVSCTTNDPSYPDSQMYGENAPTSIKNTILLKKDPTDQDIYSGYIITKDLLSGQTKSIQVIFY